MLHSKDCSPPGSQSMGFSRQEYWSGLPFPPPGDHLDPGIELTSPVSHALACRFFTTEPPGKPSQVLRVQLNYSILLLPQHPCCGCEAKQALVALN